MYHDIAVDRTAANRLAVPADAFAAQLRYLYSEGFQTLTASAVASALAQGTQLPERAVVITYDYGFADLYEIALPLLERFGFTATVYVTTEWIQDFKSSRHVRRPGKMLSWQQIRDLAEAGLEIGAHSCSHPQLDQLSKRLLGDELGNSKIALENELQRPILGMAYPFGYSDVEVRRMAQRLGYKYACAVGNRLINPSCDLFALSRLTIRRGITPAQFERVVNGRRVKTVYLPDHTLTKGWTFVRHSKKVYKRLRPF
jgi:peptidoglycan/xylan/chitin deacetylase (PgdA/CDA1 family)